MRERFRIFVCHPSDLLTDHEPHGDGLLAHALLTRLARVGHEVEVAAPAVSLEHALPAGMRVHNIDVPRGPEALRRGRYALAARRLFNRLGGKRRFDVVHQLNPVCTGLSLSFVGCGLPVVLGQYVPHWPSKRTLMSTARDLLAGMQQMAAAAMIVSTPAANSRIALRSLVQRRVVVLPYGVDTDVFSPKRSSEYGRTTILYLASLEMRKGIYTLLDAFDTVVQQIPSARLVVAGQGSESDNVADRVRRTPHAASISLAGHVARTKLPEVIRNADVFCLPSFAEPYGMAAVEAMACGLPVVVTNAGGLMHIVDDKGGRRVAPGDPSSLADALIELLRSRELRQKMGAHNRSVTEALFGWDRVVERLESIYAGAIARPARLVESR